MNSNQRWIRTRNNSKSFQTAAHVTHFVCLNASLFEVFFFAYLPKIETKHFYVTFKCDIFLRREVLMMVGWNKGDTVIGVNDPPPSNKVSPARSVTLEPLSVPRSFHLIDYILSLLLWWPEEGSAMSPSAGQMWLLLKHVTAGSLQSDCRVFMTKKCVILPC